MSTVSSENFVEQRDIPTEALELYRYAEGIREEFARGITYNPKNLEPDFVMTKTPEDQLMRAVEDSYAEAYKNIPADRSKYRPLKSSTYKRAVVIFYTTTTIGLDTSLYMALIPFYVLGDVTIEGISLSKGYCYDVYGKCTLNVPEGSRVGSWVISHVK